MSLLKEFKYTIKEDLDKSSPYQNEGHTKEGERMLRIYSIATIKAVGMRLKLPQITISTAWVYFHRFYAKHSYSAHDRQLVLTAALFLASKVEETPKPIRAVIHAAYSHRFRKDPSIREKILNHEESYNWVKDRVLVVERSLLYTIGFDFNITSPYKYIVELHKILKEYLRKHHPHTDVENTDLLQVAWNFANDSYRLNLCLQYEAPKMAMGCMYLACKLLEKNGKLDLTEIGSWNKLWTNALNYIYVDEKANSELEISHFRVMEARKAFRMSSEEIADFSKQMLELYCGAENLLVGDDENVNKPNLEIDNKDKISTPMKIEENQEARPDPTDSKVVEPVKDEGKEETKAENPLNGSDASPPKSGELRNGLNGTNAHEKRSASELDVDDPNSVTQKKMKM